MLALVVAVCAYPFLPLDDAARSVVYDVIGVAALSLAVIGLRRHRPVRGAGWLLLVCGYGAWVVADVVFNVEQYVMHQQSYPAWSDAIYIAGYVFLVAGALTFVRGRRTGRDPAALLDACIFTLGVTVPALVFVVAPSAADSSLTGLGQLVTTSYPFLDLLLLGLVARLLTTPGAHTPAFWLLAASLGATLAADVGWDGMVIADPASAVSRWFDIGWMASYIFLAAAVRSASMVTLTEKLPADDRLPSTRRLVTLAVGSLLPALTLALDGLDGGTIAWMPISIGGALLSVLVLARMAGLLGRVRIQAVQLAALARTDALTGAPNRRTWDHELGRACAYATEHGTLLSVAIIDLDNFKRFNDSRGHQAGDLLLRDAVAAWTAALDEEVVLARYGGEEFALLLPGLEATAARTRVLELRTLTPSGQTFSAGVASWGPGRDPAAIVAAADKALYDAKRLGRNRVELADGVRCHELPEKLARFTIVVQPIIDMVSGAVAGHEALARFEHETDVAAVFERAHADGVGDLLEAATVRAALALPGRPVGQKLFVNVSAVALASPRFQSTLPARLDNIVFELVEDSTMTNWSAMTSALAQLVERGAQLAVDDLGAGAGDISRLLVIRPRIVKIDRGLVHGCSHDAHRAQLVEAVLQLAHAGGAIVCAEGVEEDADLTLLREMGIELVQGYLTGRPSLSWAAPRAPCVRPTARHALASSPGR